MKLRGSSLALIRWRPTTSIRWWLRTLSVGMILLVGLTILAQTVWTQGTNQAGLVIIHGDGSMVGRCVEFSEPQITGYDLLQRSALDLNIEVSGMGATICRIDGEGCTYPAQSCFCGTEGDSYTYWSYWQLADGAWQYSNLGASNHLVQPGTVQGWVWGVGSATGANPPPAIALADLCAVPTVTPTVTPTAPESATATPTATPLPLPTNTATVAPTAILTVTPLSSATWTPVPLPTTTGTATWTATPPPPQITLFAADPSTVTVGSTVTLLWQVKDAAQVILRGPDGENSLGSVGNLVVQPQQSTSYTLVARNASGESTAAVMIAVEPVVAKGGFLPVPTVLPTVEVLASTVTPFATETPLVMPTEPLPDPTHTPTQSTATPVSALNIAPIVLVTVPPGPLLLTPDVAQSRLQLVSVLGGVAVAIVVPLGLLCLAALFWMVKNNR